MDKVKSEIGHILRQNLNKIISKQSGADGKIWKMHRKPEKRIMIKNRNA